MLRFADLLEDHNDEIAALEAWDSGKPYEQAAKLEVPMMVRLFRYYAGMMICTNIQFMINGIYVDMLHCRMNSDQVGQIRFMV